MHVFALSVLLACLEQLPAELLSEEAACSAGGESCGVGAQPADSALLQSTNLLVRATAPPGDRLSHHNAVFTLLSSGRSGAGSMATAVREAASGGLHRSAGSSIIFIFVVLLLMVLVCVFWMVVAFKTKRNEAAQAAKRSQAMASSRAHASTPPPKVHEGSAASTPTMSRADWGPATRQLPLPQPAEAVQQAAGTVPRLTPGPGAPQRTVSMAEAQCLCEELLVPEGHECVLALPSVLGLKLGADAHQLQVLDKLGGPLISVALRRSNEGGGQSENMTLTSGRGSAILALGSVQQPQGAWGGKPRAMLFWPSGDMFGQLEEMPRSDSESSETSSSTRGVHAGQRQYVLATSGAAQGGRTASWQLVVTLDEATKRMTVTNETSGLPPRTVAALGPGDRFEFGPTSMQYTELRVASLTDTSVVILVCLAVHRMLTDTPA